jgi:hypothetical protein
VRPPTPSGAFSFYAFYFLYHQAWWLSKLIPHYI